MYRIYQRVVVTRCIHVLSGTYAYIYSYTFLSAMKSRGGSLEKPHCFAAGMSFLVVHLSAMKCGFLLLFVPYLSAICPLFVHFQVSLDTGTPPPYKYLKVGVSSQWTRKIWVMCAHLGLKQQETPLFRVTSFFWQCPGLPIVACLCEYVRYSD